MAGIQVESLRTRQCPFNGRVINAPQGASGVSVSRRSGFSLIDLLVSMAVITVLIGLLMPSIGAVREAARRVVCSSNVRQHGLGVAMYAEDYRGFLPFSKFGNPDRPVHFQPQLMTILHTAEEPATWDGLGVLFNQEYLQAPGVFYCPSHRGEHFIAAYASNWASGTGRIDGNYQYRGGIDQRLDTIGDSQALVTDGLRSQADFNHKVGSNVLRADFAVGWFSDSNGRFAASLPTGENETDAAAKVTDAWQTIDFSFYAGR